jgi:hypothetical protein
MLLLAAARSGALIRSEQRASVTGVNAGFSRIRPPGWRSENIASPSRSDAPNLSSPRL